MTVGRDDVARVAQLAELAVADDELPALAQQFNGILEFVAQLEAVAVPAEAPPPVVGPPRVALRDDVVVRPDLQPSPAELAPEFAAGLYLVPRRGTMEDDS